MLVVSRHLVGQDVTSPSDNSHVRHFRCSAWKSWEVENYVASFWMHVFAWNDSFSWESKSLEKMQPTAGLGIQIVRECLWHLNMQLPVRKEGLCVIRCIVIDIQQERSCSGHGERSCTSNPSWPFSHTLCNGFWAKPAKGTKSSRDLASLGTDRVSTIIFQVCSGIAACPSTDGRDVFPDCLA